MLTIDFKYLPIQKGDSILDLGCGQGRHGINVCLAHEAVNVVAVDLASEDLMVAQTQLQQFRQLEQCKHFFLAQADGLCLPFADNSFNQVICSEVLEHVPNYQMMLKEINRVLKQGGWAILQVPFFYPLVDITEEDSSITDPLLREKLYGQSDHVRRYGKDYADRIRQWGFRVTEDEYCSSLPIETRKKYALPEDEIIYFCEKV